MNLVKQVEELEEMLIDASNQLETAKKLQRHICNEIRHLTACYTNLKERNEQLEIALDICKMNKKAKGLSE